MKVTLLDHTADPVQKIGQMASICYDAKTDPESNIKRAKHCKDKGHLMTLRFAYATINVQEISRVCSHQLVRMAHAGILQESQRYVEQANVQFVMPPALMDMPSYFQSEWGKHLAVGRSLYREGIENGMKKEDARYILSQSCTTSLNLCLNFQGWRDVIRNRTAKAAQWEIRELFLEIERQLTAIAPEIFGDTNE
jgi:thymidylate synthase (FAD)